MCAFRWKPYRHPLVDAVLAGQGLRREVALNVTHWLLVPVVLRDTDLLAVMSGERAAQRIAWGRTP